jgi:predicted lactoylglutathione lyase
MTTPALRPRMTAVTLGVRDLRASTRFYEALVFARKFRSTGVEIAFIDAGGVVLALWDWQNLADDARLSADAAPKSFRGSTLAWNCRTDGEVDAAFARALAAGAKPLRRPERTDYGGYRGYFTDPDGHVWEVVRAPGFKFDADGALILPV